MNFADWVEAFVHCLMGLSVIYLVTETALLSTPEFFIWAAENWEELSQLWKD